ncbi:SOUL heme-binding protein [Salinisphaera hydrothermalis C41B8]|uniref:SOUL heme-binding protein n=2 Tax=Salinisphaera TaxID=180541 RepID=A0A084INA4_SALHC|nr:SOUL heme-binding protein [Salinisphaera hydrothermalis C41B8]
MGIAIPRFGAENPHPPAERAKAGDVVCLPQALRRKRRDTMQRWLLMTTLVGSLFSAGCSVFGYRGDTETPHYDVVDRIGDVTIRRYAARLAADTVVDTPDVIDARQQGFKRLAGYIFGGNTTKTEIAMTAPVAQSTQKIEMTAPVSQTRTGAGWRIRFFLPSRFNRANAPQPNDDRVVLQELPPETFAVLRFSNSRSEAAVREHTAALEQALAGSRWQPSGAPVAWFYDPPWTLPFLRRNEVAIPVHQTSETPQP